MTLLLRESFAFLPKRTDANPTLRISRRGGCEVFEEHNFPVLTPIFSTRQLLNAIAPHLLHEDRPLDNYKVNLAQILIRFACSVRYSKELSFDLHDTSDAKLLKKAIRKCPYIQTFRLYDMPGAFGVIYYGEPHDIQDISSDDEENEQPVENPNLFTMFHESQNWHDCRNLFLIGLDFKLFGEHLFDRGLLLSRAKFDELEFSYPRNLNFAEFLPKLLPRCKNTLKKFAFVECDLGYARTFLFNDEVLILLCENAPQLQILRIECDYPVVTKNDTLAALGTLHYLSELDIPNLLDSIAHPEEQLDFTLLHFQFLETLTLAKMTNFTHWECLPRDCFPNLKSLTLNGVETEGMDVHQFFTDCVFEFSRLENLKIDMIYHPVSIKNESIVKSFGKLKNLKKLSLLGVGPSDELFETFLCNLPPNIEEIDFKANNGNQTDREQRRFVISLLEKHRDTLREKHGAKIRDCTLARSDYSAYGYRSDQDNKSLVADARREFLNYLSVLSEVFYSIEKIKIFQREVFGLNQEAMLVARVAPGSDGRKALIRDEIASVLAKFVKLRTIEFEGFLNKNSVLTQTVVSNEFWEEIDRKKT
jgi:hypothetical protein